MSISLRPQPRAAGFTGGTIAAKQECAAVPGGTEARGGRRKTRTSGEFCH